MSDRKEDKQRRVTVRLDKERFEKISDLVKRKLYRDISGFLRTSVELLLVWENEIETDQINDSLLRASVETKLVKANQIEQLLPLVKKEFLEKEAQIRKDREKLFNDAKIFLKFCDEITEVRKIIQSEGRASVNFFVGELKKLNEVVSDPMFKKQFKEWEKNLTGRADAFFDNYYEFPILKMPSTETEEIVKEMLKEEEKKKSHGQGEGSST